MSTSLLWEIRVFCTVVERQSFVAAARLLGRSPSAVTRAIQALEQAVGSELLQRSQKLLSLTAAGASYYPHARQILDLQAAAEEALAGLGGEAPGWIRCAAPESLSIGVLPAVLADFGRQHPDVSIDVRFSDEPLDPIQEKLDFTIRGAFPQSSELIGFPLWNYRRHLYASPDYIRRMGLPLHPDELARHELIMHTAPRILKDWHFVADGEQRRFRVAPRYRLNSGAAVYHAARAGAGIARLADWLAEAAVRDNALVKVCPAYRLTSSAGLDPQMHAVYARGRLPARVRLFLDALRQGWPQPS